MTQSMTAFSRWRATRALGDAVWEIRSVNHRFLEINLRLPEAVRSLESPVRKMIGARLKRGKIDCTLKFDESDRILPEHLDETSCRNLVRTLRQLDILVDNYPLRAPTSLDLLHWPGIRREEAENDTVALRKQLLESLDLALGELTAARSIEGQHLKDAVLSRIEEIEHLVGAIEAVLPKVLGDYRARLWERVAELIREPDQVRLQQELVLMATKLDVAEELERLAIHTGEFRSVLERDEPIGRRLDFMTQELNREVNTIASKSADASVTQMAVDLKVLVEQIREQVQNIE